MNLFECKCVLYIQTYALNLNCVNIQEYIKHKSTTNIKVKTI